MNVNIDKTRNYYSSYTPCDCLDCKNYYRQIEILYPKLCAYLKSYGIDPLKPDELIPLDNANKITYFECMYIVLGDCEEIDICDIDNIHISKVIEDYPSLDIDDKYFFISFGPISFDNLIKQDFAKLDSMIARYNSISERRFTEKYNYFLECLDYVSKLEADGYIIRKDKKYKKISYLKSILENDGPEYSLVLSFSNLYGDKYEIGVCVRGTPLLRKIQNKNDIIKNKKGEIRPTFRIKQILGIIYLIIMILFITPIIVLLSLDEEKFGLISIILFAIYLFISFVILAFIPLIRRKEIKYEMAKYDFEKYEENKEYTFEDENENKHTAKWLSNGLLVDEKIIPYDSINAIVYTDNSNSSVSIIIEFGFINKDGKYQEIVLDLDGTIIKNIMEHNINVENKYIIDCVLKDKKAAFTQIYKYGQIYKYRRIKNKQPI